MESNQRIEWIDWTKGLCMVLIVMGHVIRGFISAGMFQNIPLDYLDYTIYSFHMPLMFFISGMLYVKNRKEKIKNWKSFIINKIVKLYIPYLIFAYIMFFFKVFLSTSINSSVAIKELITIPIKPFDIYWFLLALLSIFVVYSFMDYKNVNHKVILGFGLVSLIISFYIEQYMPNLYYIKNIFYYIGLGFYFYLGSELFNRKLNKKILIPLIAGYIVLNVMNYYFQWKSSIIEILMALTMIIFLVIYAQNYKKSLTTSNFIVKMGRESMIIYVIHTFFTAFTRILLNKLNVTSFIIQLVAGTIMGILLPLIVYACINRYKILNWCNFLFYPKLKERKNETR